MTPTGQQIRTLRLSLFGPRSLRSTARALGVSPAYLSDIEEGRRNAPPATLKRIALLLGVPVEPWLLAWAEESLDAEVLAAVRKGGER